MNRLMNTSMVRRVRYPEFEDDNHKRVIKDLQKSLELERRKNRLIAKEFKFQTKQEDLRKVHKEALEKLQSRIIRKQMNSRSKRRDTEGSYSTSFYSPEVPKVKKSLKDDLDLQVKEKKLREEQAKEDERKLDKHLIQLAHDELKKEANDKAINNKAVKEELLKSWELHIKTKSLQNSIEKACRLNDTPLFNVDNVQHHPSSIKRRLQDLEKKRERIRMDKMKIMDMLNNRSTRIKNNDNSALIKQERDKKKGHKRSETDDQLIKY